MRLRILDLMPQYQNTDPNDLVQLSALAKFISDKLMKMKPFTGSADAPYVNGRRIFLANQFKEFSLDPSASKDDFNRLMIWLFGWGETPMGQFGTDQACYIRIDND